MKTEYKYIQLNSYEIGPPWNRVKIWQVFNNKDEYICQIEWDNISEYVLSEDKESINKGCLEDINDFITQLMEERKG